MSAFGGIADIPSTDLDFRSQWRRQDSNNGDCHFCNQLVRRADDPIDQLGRIRNRNPDWAANRWRETMEIKRSGSQPSAKGPSDWFTGTVRLDPLFQAPDPARVSAASVTFEPGARTAWHTHPLGQTLIVTAGCGWVQREGDRIEEIRPGDVVWFPPGEKHWHGATPTTAMTHIAVQEMLDGKAVNWMEKVADEQYSR
jgi:quercetin dioxygenase-like cupin family protein